MINYAIGSFCVAVLLGIILLSYVLRSKETPKIVAILHGLFAAGGLIMLLLYALQKSDNTMWFAGIFLIVALVGFYMFSRDLTGKGIPKAVALTHGVVAISTLAALFYFVTKT